jgi:hypothetical protein
MPRFRLANYGITLAIWRIHLVDANVKPATRDCVQRAPCFPSERRGLVEKRLHNPLEFTHLWGMDPRKIVTIENMHLFDRAVPARPLAPSERRRVFGYFGQIDRYKGFEVSSDERGSARHTDRPPRSGFRHLPWPKKAASSSSEPNVLVFSTKIKCSKT